jgi:acetyltransferase-like isoleucine patch superfamily enzyme
MTSALKLGRAWRVLRFAWSLIDPRSYLHLLRLIHFNHYSHVAPRRQVKMGPGIAMAPNVSFRNGERIAIGKGSHIGSRCSLWAGDSRGRIVLGDHCLLAPDVFITASNYRMELGRPVMSQARDERDVIIGEDVWLGARVTVLPGVEIGDGCVVAAGAVVTCSLPPYSIAAGAPARIVKSRGESAVNGSVASRG